MKNLKGWSKLSLQIALLSASMIGLSFITETEIWLKYFNNLIPEGECAHFGGKEFRPEHYHWNYRGWIYVLT